MFNDFKSIPNKLNQILDKRRKIYLLLLLFMAIIFSLVETAGVSVIMPFISVASNPDLLDSGYYKLFYDLSKLNSPTRFIFTFGFVIIIFYFFRSLYIIFYNYLINRYSLGTYKYFAGRLFKIYLSLPFRIFVQKF